MFELNIANNNFHKKGVRCKYDEKKKKSDGNQKIKSKSQKKRVSMMHNQHQRRKCDTEKNEFYKKKTLNCFRMNKTDAQKEQEQFHLQHTKSFERRKEMQKLTVTR